MTPVIAAPWLLVLHDTGEGDAVKTRPTDQGAVDVGLRHERVDVLRLDAAAVEDAHPLRGGGRSEAHQLAANGVVDFLGLPRGRGASGADRPHRLVGDDAAGQLLGARAGERALHLPCDHRPARLERGEGRRDHDLPPAPAPHALGERARQCHRLAARAVHLPVAGDERGATHRGTAACSAGAASSSATSPGSARPSRNSSAAPPPVATWVTAPCSPARASAATESPPPTTVVPVDSASACAIAIVPRLKASTSKMPMGPFQSAVRAAAISCANASVACGPTSTPSRLAGKSSAPTTRVVAPASGRSAARWSTGRRMRTPRAAARARVAAARSTLSASTRERPTGFPCARRNV